MKVEQLQTENNAAGGLSDLTDVLGVAVSPAPTFPILTGRVGTNADQFPDVLEMYVPEGATVADVTYGKGVFWRNIPDGKYNLLATDLQTGTDFSRLPYENQSIDALVLDPPIHARRGNCESQHQ